MVVEEAGINGGDAAWYHPVKARGDKREKKEEEPPQSLQQCQGVLDIKLKPLFSSWEHIIVHISISLSVAM